MSDDKLAKHVEVFRKREECRATLIELRRTRARSAQQLAALAAELDELGKLESRERSRLAELTQETVKLLYADSAGLVADRLDDHNRLAGADVVAAVDGTNVHPITRS
jgi:chromosome segregation ATPase